MKLPSPTKGLLLMSLLLGSSASAAPAYTPAKLASVKRAGKTSLETRTIRGPGGNHEVLAGEILVKFEAGRNAEIRERTAKLMGSRVLGEGKRSGLTRLALPEGLDLEGFLDQARRSAGIAWAGPNAVIEGQNTCYPQASDHLAKQWYLSRVEHDAICESGQDDSLGVLVAVLDTGIAYEDRKVKGVQHRLVPDLAHTSFFSPYNALDGSENALDDHQHGTHIAGIIAAQGGTVGIAPNAQLMPVKVLDHEKRGTELALIEGILHAVDNGADVINMSLSFGPGYFPTPGLQDAIATAAEAGVVMVAASGNDGLNGVGWPAAFPDVIAVGASRAKASDVEKGQKDNTSSDLSLNDKTAEYSNTGFALDLVAPGGRFDSDFDKDGLPDAILAQTFSAGQPDDLGYWYASGTSQAAAEVSGAAAWLIGAGTAPEQVGNALTGAALSKDANQDFDPQMGAGHLKTEGALELAMTGPPPEPERYFVNILPWIERSLVAVDVGPVEEGTTSEPVMEEQVRFHARVEVIDAGGSAAGDVTVGGCFYGSLHECHSKSTGKAHQGISSVEFTSSWFAPTAEGLAAAFLVNGIATPGSQQAVRPQQYVSMSPAGAETLYRLISQPEIGESTLLLEIGPDDEALNELLEATPEHGYVVKPLGAGLRSGAMSMVFDAAFAPELEAAKQTSATAISWAWPSPLDSGWGPVTGASALWVEAEVPNLGGGEQYLVMPLDPAMITTDLSRFYPIINAPVEHFETRNAAFGDAAGSSILGDAFASSALGHAFASSPLGDAFASSPLGDAFAASALGNAFASSPLGAAFASSPLGAGFAASALGRAFASSPLGAGFAASSLGANNGEDDGAGTVALDDVDASSLTTSEDDLTDSQVEDPEPSTGGDAQESSNSNGSNNGNGKGKDKNK